MKVPTRVLAVVCAAIFGFAVPLWAQTADYAPVVAPSTGTFGFNFTITASSTVPKNGVVVIALPVTATNETTTAVQLVSLDKVGGNLGLNLGAAEWRHNHRDSKCNYMKEFGTQAYPFRTGTWRRR